MRKANKGVTLIELLMVIVVLGILAAIAIPSYASYMRRAARADAKATLLAAAGQLERCFTRFNAYNAAGCTWTSGLKSPEGKYTIAAATRTATDYVLKATPVSGSGQEKDTECATFTLTSANARGNEVSGTATSAAISQRCWGK